MKFTLYLKFIFAYLIFGFLSFFTIATLTSGLTKNYLLDHKIESLYKEATVVAGGRISQYYNDEEDTRTSVYSNLVALASYQESQIWWLDNEGNVMVNTSQSLDTDHLENIPDFDPTASGNQNYQLGTFYDYFTEETLSVMAPVTVNFEVQGYIVFHYPMSSLLAERDAILNITYITLLVIFILSLIILAAFTIMVYYPLKKITIAAKEYAAGNLSYELPVNSDDEIGHLSATLNYMASELNQSEEYQKKFVANISHDFRSPLTSIKGYVEAILDGTIPPELQDKYLNIVLFETERLNKLTSNLLTLNDFNTKKTILDITTFDINAIIKNTATSFEGTCRQKKISIELILTGKTLYVSADMGKIQQVLYNLIDNAIKFSDDDSVIYVETTEKHEKIFVSVKDSGIGIPKESLKKIWERFYKTDLSRGKDKKGTGLGLAITREIIQTHEENIDVISTPGVGTEFIFTLPKAQQEEVEDDELEDGNHLD